MWSSILGVLTGGASAIVPAVVNVIDKRNERSFDLKKLDIEAALAREGKLSELRTAELSADVEESKQVYAQSVAEIQAAATGNWMAMYISSVRPTVSYLVVLTYIAVKLSQVAQAWSAGAPMELLFTESDFAIYGAVIGFYFGGRALTRFGFVKK